jgi:hypothetical protein
VVPGARTPDWADQLSLRLMPDELWELVQLPHFRPAPRAAAPEGYSRHGRGPKPNTGAARRHHPGSQKSVRELFLAAPPCPGAIPFRRGLWHEFNTALRIGLDAALRIGDIAGKAHMHRALGRGYALLGSFEEGSLTRARAAGHPGGQAGVPNNIGLYHVYLGNYQEALACRQEALHWIQRARQPSRRRPRTGQPRLRLPLPRPGHSGHHLLPAIPERIPRVRRPLLSSRHAYPPWRNSPRHRKPEGAHRAWQAPLSILIELHHTTWI